MEPEKKERYLEISRLWREHQGEQGVASFICKTLKVSGKDLGKVKQLIEKGVIAYDQENNPFYTISFEDAERAIKSSKEDSEVAEGTVVDTVKGAIAGETKALTEQYLILGKAIWQAVAYHAAKKGLSPEDLKGMPVHEMVLDALDKSEKVDPLEKKLKDLEDELSVYRKEVDPMYRLRESCRLIVEFMRTASLAKIAGFNPYAMLPHYEKIINSYMRGEV